MILHGKPPTARQASLLAFIRQFVDQTGYCPSLREMATHMGIQPNGVRDHLQSLARRGCIEIAPGRARAIRFLTPVGGLSSSENRRLLSLLRRLPAGTNRVGEFTIGRAS